jgi:hypothetical protein
MGVSQAAAVVRALISNGNGRTNRSGPCIHGYHEMYVDALNLGASRVACDLAQPPCLSPAFDDDFSAVAASVEVTLG